MKTSDAFKKTIREYLEQRAKEDELFAVSYAKENKNIDECCNFILQQVQKSGCNGFNDEEIYSMAVHYYDEDSIKNIKLINCNVVVNHSIELTEEDKKAAHELAMKKLIDEQHQSLRKKPGKKKEVTEVQLSLFEF